MKKILATLAALHRKSRTNNRYEQYVTNELLHQADLIRGYKVNASFKTDTGRVRRNNEDSWIVYHYCDNDTKGLLCIVADGMGGHSSGEIASRLAVDLICKYYSASTKPPYYALLDAFHNANSDIYNIAKKNIALSGMGTTCTAVVISGGTAYYAHVGDSRLYLIRDGQIHQLSEDQTLVWNLLRNGIITREAALNHPEKNVLSQAFGTKAELQISVWDRPLPIQYGDQFILCSDGLYELVDENDLLQISLTFKESEAAEKLVRKANENGGFDNITVGIMRIDPDTMVSIESVKSTRDLPFALS